MKHEAEGAKGMKHETEGAKEYMEAHGRGQMAMKKAK